MSDFLVASAQQEARRIVAETQVIRLSLEGQRRFAEMLIDPPEPTPALRRAFERYRRFTGQA